jgi:hypothetical protein
MSTKQILTLMQIMRKKLRWKLQYVQHGRIHSYSNAAPNEVLHEAFTRYTMGDVGRKL